MGGVSGAMNSTTICQPRTRANVGPAGTHYFSAPNDPLLARAEIPYQENELYVEGDDHRS